MSKLSVRKDNLVTSCNYLIFISFIVILSESILFSFRNFNIGVVGETESVIIAFYVFSSFIALGILGILLLNKNNSIKQYLSHPLTVFFFCIALISFIFSFFTNLPIRSWFGSFTTGEGVFSYLSITMLIIAGLYIKPHKTIFKFAGIFALIATLFLVFMQYYGDDIGLYRPYPMFNSFLAFFGLFLMPILFSTLNPKRTITKIAIIVLSISIVFLAENRTALIALFFTVLVFLFFLLLKYKKVRHIRSYVTVLILLSPICVWFTTFVVGEYVYKNTNYPELASTYTRYNLHYSILEYNKDANIWGKLFGNGWGSFQDIKKRELPYYRVNLHNVHPLDRELLYDTHFHSHNNVLEALFSIGIIGAIFIWVLPAVVIWLCPGRHLLLAIWTSFFYSSLGAMWFQLPLTVPFMAFSFVCLSRNRVFFLNKIIRKSCRVFQVRHWMLGLIFIALLSAAYTLYQKRTYRPIDPSALNNLYYLSEYGKNWQEYIPDLNEGGQRLAYMYDLYNKQLLDTKNNQELMPQEINSIEILNNFTNEAIKAHKAGIALRVIQIEYINKWHDANMPRTKDNIAIKNMFLTWPDKLQSFLKNNPERSDLAAPFLQLKLKEKDYTIVEKISNQILDKNPNDPVALWFKAEVLENRDNNVALAKLLKAKARDNHISNIIKID
tara:strand:- start:16023 stop:18023 length:2001 start_codon:yes stop_codon:yes gene_type:complete